MRNKTLVIRLLKLFLISTIYGVSIYPYAPFWMLLLGVSVALGFGTWLGVGLVVEAFLNRRDARLIKAALDGQKGADRKPMAVLGKLFPIKNPIRAPFSGRECQIVGYDIYQKYWTKRRAQSSSSVAEPISYNGFHLAPSEVWTGSEKVKILGFPELSDVPEEETTSYGGIESFIEQTNFTKPIHGFIKGVNELSKTIPVSENGAAAEDFKHRNPVEGQSLKSREQIVKKGAEVCLIGIFDAGRGGIVPDKRPFGRKMRLIPGNGKYALSKLTKDSGIVVAFGLAIAVLCISIGLLPHLPDDLLRRIPAGDSILVHLNSLNPQRKIISDKIRQEKEQPISKKVKLKQEQSTSEAETPKILLLIQNGDADSVRKELSKGLDPDIHIPRGHGYSLLLIESINANQLEIARLLLKAGADINALNSHKVNGLDAAVSARKTEAVRLLLEAGAEIYIGDAQRLSPVNRAILNQDEEILALLLEAGADPSPPGCDMVVGTLPADSEKTFRIRKLLDMAREKHR